MGFFDSLNKNNIQIFSICQDDMEYHSHNFLELVYITRGRGIHYLDGKSSVVNEGDYFIIDYKSRHKYKNIDDEGFDLINCLFKPEFIDPSLRGCESFFEVLSGYLIRFGSIGYTAPPTRFTYQDPSGKVRDIMRGMLDEYEGRKKGSLEILRCRLVEIIILTMRKIMDSSAENMDATLTEMVSYIDKNFISDISLTEIASMLNMTPQYLSAKFKTAMGMTFTEYVQKKRIGLCCRLLTATDKKIIEIAQLSGFGDIKFFNSVFKKHMNTTPREFRRTMKAGSQS